MRRQMPPVPTGPNWEQVRDLRVQEAAVEAEIEVRHLQEEGALFHRRQQAVGVAIEEVGESEPSLRRRRGAARMWGGLLLFATAVVVGSTFWSLSAFTTLTWEKWLVAGSLFAMPLIGWTFYLGLAPSLGDEVFPKRVMFVVGLAMIVCSILTAILFGVGRMAVLHIKEEQAQSAPLTTDELTAAPSAAVESERLAGLKKRLGDVSMLAGFALTLLSELGIGLVFHAWYRERLIISTATGFFEESRALEVELAENAAAQEEARRWPEIVYYTLTAAALEQAGQARTPVATATPTAVARAAPAAPHAPARPKSLTPWRLTLWTLIVLGIIFLVFHLWMKMAFGAELSSHMVVVVDLSSSSRPHHAFEADLQAVEGMILRLPAGARLTVLPVTAQSFSAEVLLAASAPAQAGQFGEYLAAWRAQVRQQWRQVGVRLRPDARQSDLFGTFARAAVEFGEQRSGRGQGLLVLSDMRQVGRGFNFERPFSPAAALAQAERQGLIPRLKGVDVWVLGVHTAGIDERHWFALQEFWTGFFRRAGATLRAFSPNRRFAPTP